MYVTLSHVVLALAILAFLYVALKLAFNAYFAAKAEYLNIIIEKAKELTSNGKK